jgi:hypothetical protein
MKCPVGTFPSIRVIRGRLSRNQHRAQKQDRMRNFFVRRVEKTTDDRPAVALLPQLPQVADADTPVR